MGDYLRLKRQVADAGLLERQYGYYFLKFLTTAIMFAVSIFVLVTVDSFAFQVLNSAFLAFIFVQFGLLMHDSQHQQVFRSPFLNDLMGLFSGSLMIFLSAGAWKLKHSEHHNAPNDVDEDPDIRISLLAYSERQALEKKGLSRLIAGYQGFLWFPVLGLAAVSRRIGLFRVLAANLTGGKIRHAYLDLALVVSGASFYFFAIFISLGLWKGVAFVILNHALTGIYMGTIFATNHKAMPLTDRNRRPDFATRQIITTRNVKGNHFIDFWTGGLNYQIEHHLFPTMPRNNLSRASGFIREFCTGSGIEYYETGFFRSYREILSNFHGISKVLRRPKSYA